MPSMHRKGPRRGGAFSSLGDFCSRVDYHLVNKRALESLIKCGAMDSFGKKRSQLMAVIDQAVAMGSLSQKDYASGQIGLFDDTEEVMTDLEYPDIEEYPIEMRLAMEKEYDGFYFSGHPLSKYQEIMDRLSPLSLLYGEDGRQYDGKMLRVGGLITAKKQVMTKRNEQMAIITLEDFTHAVSIVVFPKTLRPLPAVRRRRHGRLHSGTCRHQRRQHSDFSRRSAAPGAGHGGIGSAAGTGRIGSRRQGSRGLLAPRHGNETVH